LLWLDAENRALSLAVELAFGLASFEALPKLGFLVPASKLFHLLDGRASGSFGRFMQDLRAGAAEESA
jgi:hypothetical protein